MTKSYNADARTSTAKRRQKGEDGRIADALEPGLEIRRMGFRPTVIYPRDFPRPKQGPAEGKEPFGPAWGLKDIDERTLRADVAFFVRKGWTPGWGICLGPGRGGVEFWLIDLEGDGPEAEESRAKLLGGEELVTMGWGSARGGHQLLLLDGERMAKIAPGLKSYQVKDAKNQPGVFHVPALPGLELRIGGFKEDGVLKQLQSVAPPTPGTDGNPRAWNDADAVAHAPEAFYAFLESLADAAGEAARPLPTESSGGNGKATGGEVDAWIRTQLATAYGRIALATTGHRHEMVISQAYWAAGYLHHHETDRVGFSEAELESAMIEAADKAAPERKGDNPRCVRDAIASGKGRPLDLPRRLQGLLTGSKNGHADGSVGSVSAPDPTHARNEGVNGGFVGSVGGSTHTNPQTEGGSKEGCKDCAGGADKPTPLRPLRVDLLPVPRMEPVLIPEPYRAWLADIGDRACCPLDLPVVAAIVSTAADVGRKVGIRPKRQDDWTVVPNLWGMGVLPPGWLKSHCLDEPKRPLARLEIEARERHATALAGFEIDKLIAENKAAASAAALKEASRKKLPDLELRRLAAEALAKPDLAAPTLRRYIVNDATVEKLGELQVENPNGLLVFRDELMGFLRALEKQGHESDRAYYLEGWNGDKSSSYDRIGRGSIFIPSNTISILGGIQPGRLADYIRSMASGENDDGLISRFQLAVYPDVDQPFSNIDRWPETAAKTRAYGVFKGLDALKPAEIGAAVDEGDEGSIPYLRFSAEAQGLFDEWRTDLENKVRSSRESACLTSHLSKYRSLMPSLSLLFHLIDVVGGTAPGPVSHAAAELAAAWCDYLEAHARRIYQAAFDGDIEPAQRLGERLAQSLPNPFTVRQVVQKGWATLGTTEDVERAVAILEGHGWIHRVEIPPGPTGGRPKVEFHINPLVQGGDR